LFQTNQALPHHWLIVKSCSEAPQTKKQQSNNQPTLTMGIETSASIHKHQTTSRSDANADLATCAHQQVKRRNKPNNKPTLTMGILYRIGCSSLCQSQQSILLRKSLGMAVGTHSGESFRDTPTQHGSWHPASTNTKQQKQQDWKSMAFSTV